MEKDLGHQVFLIKKKEKRGWLKHGHRNIQKEFLCQDERKLQYIDHKSDTECGEQFCTLDSNEGRTFFLDVHLNGLIMSHNLQQRSFRKSSIKV